MTSGPMLKLLIDGLGMYAGIAIAIRPRVHRARTVIGARKAGTFAHGRAPRAGGVNRLEGWYQDRSALISPWRGRDRRRGGRHRRRRPRPRGAPRSWAAPAVRWPRGRAARSAGTPRPRPRFPSPAAG